MNNMLSTTAVARLLGVAVGSVAKWIDQGELRAGRTPGGHRRVAAPDLVAFLRRQKLPVPHELDGFTPKVLIVDDEQGVVRWLAQEIGEARPEYEILEANDGFTAGELVASERPDAVLLDIRMPGIDGIQVCRRIKSREATSHTTVIAITAQYSDKVAEEITACGAAACLAKPLDPQDIIARIEDAVGGAPSGRQGTVPRTAPTEGAPKPESGLQSSLRQVTISNPSRPARPDQP